MIIGSSSRAPAGPLDPTGTESLAALSTQRSLLLWAASISLAARICRAVRTSPWAVPGRCCPTLRGGGAARAVFPRALPLRFPSAVPAAGGGSASSCHQRSAPGSGFRSPMTLLIPVPAAAAASGPSPAPARVPLGVAGLEPPRRTRSGLAATEGDAGAGQYCLGSHREAQRGCCPWHGNSLWLFGVFFCSSWSCSEPFEATQRGWDGSRQQGQD